MWADYLMGRLVLIAVIYLLRRARKKDARPTDPEMATARKEDAVVLDNGENAEGGKQSRRVWGWGGGPTFAQVKYDRGIYRKRYVATSR